MENFEKINSMLAAQADEPEKILHWALFRFGSGLVMSSSFGAESALLLHLANRIVPGIRVILINTRYLFPETYQFAIELTARFKLKLKVYEPLISLAESDKLLKMGNEGKAEYSWLCKVEPLQRAFRELGVRAILHGVRADQTETRANLQFVERRADGVHRIHPLLGWNKERIAEYMFKHDLPYHPLVYEGYGSIGDKHSTVKGSGREGRLLPGGECGLHLDIGSGI